MNNTAGSKSVPNDPLISIPTCCRSDSSYEKRKYMFPFCTMKISAQNGAIRITSGIGNGRGINEENENLKDNTPFALT